jgi:hypothetical protein
MFGGYGAVVVLRIGRGCQLWTIAPSPLPLPHEHGASFPFPLTAVALENDLES